MAVIRCCAEGVFACIELNSPRAAMTVSEGFWIVIAIIAAVAIYVVAKVVHYMRKSEQQWTDVDKSKLKDWEDDEDW